MSISDLRRHLRATRARLDQLNRAISNLEEREAAQQLPADVHPQHEPRKPILGRIARLSLRESILSVLAEEEAAWETRN